MTVDNSKLNYFSNWDIDQLITSDSLAVGSGTTAIYSIPPTTPIPVTDVQFQPTGSPYWYGPGTSSIDGTLAGQIVFYWYLSGTSIFANTPSAGVVRYFIWADKLNY